MSVSQLAREIHASPTLKMNEAARLLREKGEPVIHLGAGEPKSKVPIDAILSCSSKLKTADIRYTPTEGIPSLLKAIIRYTEDNYNKIVGTENVVVHAGEALWVLPNMTRASGAQFNNTMLKGLK